MEVSQFVKVIPKPAISSLKYHAPYEMFKKHQKRGKKPLQLESFMSQLIVDNPVVYEIVQKQDLDHFDQLKKLNEMHSLQVPTLKTVSSNLSRSSTTAFQMTKNNKPIKSSRPFSSLTQSHKNLIRNDIKSKTGIIVNSFSKEVKSQDRAKSVKLRRSDILSDIQRRSVACLQKFIHNNQKKEIFQHVDELMQQIQVKSKEEIANFYIKCTQLEELKTSLQRQVLELKYQICSLERVQKEQSTKISELKDQNRHLQINYQLLSKFSKDFQAVENFQPGISCRQLIAHCKKMQQLCLNKMGSNDDTQIKAAQNQIMKCREQLSSLKLSHNIVCNNLKSANQQVKQRRQLQQQQDDNKQKLTSTQQQLKLLQNRIVQFYNSWYQNRQKTIKGILKQVGCFKKQYSYMQMMDYMQLDLKNLSTPCKVDEYLRRILATIQLAQRKVFPSVTPALKIDPCKIVNQIVSYTLSLKVGCKKKQKRNKSILKQNQDDMKYVTQI